MAAKADEHQLASGRRLQGSRAVGGQSDGAGAVSVQLHLLAIVAVNI